MFKVKTGMGLRGETDLIDAYVRESTSFFLKIYYYYYYYYYYWKGRYTERRDREGDLLSDDSLPK